MRKMYYLCTRFSMKSSRIHEARRLFSKIKEGGVPCFTTMKTTNLQVIPRFFGKPEKSRSSAVGSAPRSGRGGRAFESPLLDKRTVKMAVLFVLSFLFSG